MEIRGHHLSIPVLQGGMGVGVSLGGLAGAVAACGGMGTISTADAGYQEPDFPTEMCIRDSCWAPGATGRPCGRRARATTRPTST